MNNLDIELVCRILLAISLGVLTVQDLRFGSLSLRLLFVYLVMSAACSLILMHVSVRDIFASLFPGIFVLAFSIAASGAIGEGDAVSLMIIGPVFGVWNAIYIFCAALLFSIFPAMLFYIKDKNGKRKLPFLPFLCAATVTAIVGRW